LVDLIRNHSLNVIHQRFVRLFFFFFHPPPTPLTELACRNKALFDLFNVYVHSGSEDAMNVSLDLQQKVSSVFHYYSTGLELSAPLSSAPSYGQRYPSRPAWQI
jgi:hypothetical protein